ncbi:MAG: alpha/beta hydrolase [Clostridiaceae bacterium]
MNRETRLIDGVLHAIMPPADTSGIRRQYLNLTYATDSISQKLDLYLPDSEASAYPLIVFFHGGAFTFGAKDDNQLVPILRSIDRGYAVASVEYRKSPEARFPAMVYDAKAAIRYLRAQSTRLRLDSKHFCAWGPSSGGWLASMIGVTEGNPAFEDLSMGHSDVDSSVQAVIDWCGPCGGFLNMDTAFLKSEAGVADHNDVNSPESRFLGGDITKLRELDRMACPCSYASSNTPPTLILHGGSDQIVPVEQSQAFYAALSAAALEPKHEIHIASGQLHHGAEWYNEPWVMELCLDFLGKVFSNCLCENSEKKS